ncbi:MAG: hypothetical protein R6U39_06490 [Candidatus Aegiribacteria sp.]
MGYIEHLIRSIFRREASRKATEVVMNNMNKNETCRESTPEPAESGAEEEEDKEQSR